MTVQTLWHSCSAVLFDFDGVLADSEPFYRKTWNTVLERYGHTVSEGDYWKYWSFLGEGLEGEIERHGLRIPSTSQARSLQKRLYKEYCLSGQIPLFPLASRVLQMTRACKTCAIASNTDAELVAAILSAAGGPDLPVIGGNGLRPKPFPDVFLKAAATLGVPPGNCLVLEDAMKGIKAGSSAGMPVILVRNRYNSGLDASGAACEISGLNELFDFLWGLQC